MKKKMLICLVLLSTLLTGLCAFAETTWLLQKEMSVQQPVLSPKLRNCTPYIYNGDTFVAHVVGKRNGFCYYRFYSAVMNLDCEIPLEKIKDYSQVNPVQVCKVPEDADPLPSTDFRYNVFFQ